SAARRIVRPPGPGPPSGRILDGDSPHHEVVDRMRQTFKFGRLGGTPIGMHWSVLVIMVLLAQGLAMTILPQTAPGHPSTVYWLVALAVTVAFLAALLAHETAHALAARRFGVRVRRITLWLLGGVAELDGEAPHARGDFLIAVAGPLTSLG